MRRSMLNIVSFVTCNISCYMRRPKSQVVFKVTCGVQCYVAFNVVCDVLCQYDVKL
jgi:hypothetical protein